MLHSTTQAPPTSSRMAVRAAFLRNLVDDISLRNGNSPSLRGPLGTAKTFAEASHVGPESYLVSFLTSEAIAVTWCTRTQTIGTGSHYNPLDLKPARLAPRALRPLPRHYERAPCLRRLAKWGHWLLGHPQHPQPEATTKQVALPRAPTDPLPSDGEPPRRQDTATAGNKHLAKAGRAVPGDRQLESAWGSHR